MKIGDTIDEVFLIIYISESYVYLIDKSKYNGPISKREI